MVTEDLGSTRPLQGQFAKKICISKSPWYQNLLIFFLFVLVRWMYQTFTDSCIADQLTPFPMSLTLKQMDSEWGPRTCCSRAVITFTACCRIMSLVKGWLDPDWRDTISPSSLNASLMSRTRSLKIRKTPSPLVVQNCPTHPWPVLTLCVKVTLR